MLRQEVSYEFVRGIFSSFDKMLSGLMIPYILLQSEFTQAIQILPLVKECFDESRSNEECKVISYQLISFMQLVFYRSDEFKSFSGIKIMNKEERDRLINMQLNSLIR